MAFLARIGIFLALFFGAILINVLTYAIMRAKENPIKAKEMTIKVFIILMSIITGFFLLVALYAVQDKNLVVAELSLWGAGMFAIGIGGGFIWRWRFYKKNPKYKTKKLNTAEIIDER